MNPAPTPPRLWTLAGRQLMRDLRAGELRLLLVAVMLAVAALSAVGFFADRLNTGLARDARQLLGGARRVDALPDVATVAEAIPGFETDGWQGLFAPAGTPSPIVARMSAEAAAALRDPELVRTIAQLGFRTVANSPAEFTAVLRRDHAKWSRIIRERNIKPD